MAMAWLVRELQTYWKKIKDGAFHRKSIIAKDGPELFVNTVLNRFCKFYTMIQ